MFVQFLFLPLVVPIQSYNLCKYVSISFYAEFYMIPNIITLFFPNKILVKYKSIYNIQNKQYILLLVHI